jgi:hypothetical protein
MLLVLLAGCQPAEPQTTPDGAAEPGAAETVAVVPTSTVEPSATAPEAGVTASATAEPVPVVTDEADENGTETPEQPQLEILVRQDLAQRLEVDPEAIEIVTKEAVEWPNGAMGCPAPGAVYTQAIVPGFRMVLEVDGERYEYHTDRQQRFLLCEGGEPQFPAIPIDPGDIDDGEPWVPVDPLPTVETP